MPLLSWADPLVPAPQRVLVAGASGAGKTTLAAAVSALLDLPHTEIDGLYHGPGWVPRPEFLDDVQTLAAAPRWVTEWNYRAARPLLLARADTLAWLDLPRAQVLAQVLARTLRRRLGRIVLWNGNVEPPLWTFLTDPEHVVRWSWHTHRKAADRVRAVLAGLDGNRVRVVRLGSHAQARRWLDRAVRVAAGSRPD